MMDILTAKDTRVSLIEAMLAENNVVISIRCNYPGVSKANYYTSKVITIISNIVSKQLNIYDVKTLTTAEGPIFLAKIHGDGKIIKEKMIKLEDQHPLGRLVDIDVYFKSIKSLSRKDFTGKLRKCFLCNDYAFNCIVNKRHDELSLQAYFHKQVETFENLPLDIIEYTNQAMLYELNLYPSFGLVSPYSQGAHSDMDHFTFIDSISVLNKYMLQFAYLGYQNESVADLLNEAIAIGKACEEAMFTKTKGVNTHKGLIFVLGTLVVSVMNTIYHGEAFEAIFANIIKLTKPKLSELDDLNKNLSNGKKIYLKYKLKGVRQEASLGFPLIQKALDIFAINDKKSYVKTLIYLMSVCNDTTIIHRKGLEGLTKVKTTMSKLFKHGYSVDELFRVDKQFVKEGISPGGSADLLCGTIFLSLIKNNIFKRRE